jgi:hypothetical protein
MSSEISTDASLMDKRSQQAMNRGHDIHAGLAILGETESQGARGRPRSAFPASPEPTPNR